jgi:hypothetical protein
MFMKSHKLLATAVGAVFVLSSVAALADDKTQSTVTPQEQAKMKADKDAAMAKNAKMTPEEKQAAKKAKHHAKQKEMAGIEKTGNPQPDGKDISAAAAATKSDAKTTTEQRKASASQQTKPTTGQ